MNITPLDIQQKKFIVAFRGYERAEVDVFLEQVREEMERLVRENAELAEFRQGYDERVREFRSREETLKNTLVTTQRLAEDIKETARKEADAIVKDAQARAQQIIAKAQEEKVRLDSEVHELGRKRHHAVLDLRKMLQTHLEMLNYDAGGGTKGGQAGNH